MYMYVRTVLYMYIQYIKMMITLFLQQKTAGEISNFTYDNGICVYTYLYIGENVWKPETEILFWIIKGIVGMA